MSWSGWFDLGAPSGGLTGGPATVSRNKDVCNIYVRGADNALWQRAYFGGAWYEWVRHNDGGVLASEPALGSMGPDHEHVFVRGTDGNVWQKYWTAEVEPSAEVSFGVSECVYNWTAGYQQTGTHVTVRIQLNPDPAVTAAALTALQATWRNGIIATWSSRFNCGAPNGGRQAITFDVQWVGSNAHHVVRVQAGPARSNMGVWDTQDTGDVAAHEFGHMLGHPDEYADAACPGRIPVNTGTVMEDNTETVARLYNRIATFHGGGHSPLASVNEPTEAAPEVPMNLKLIDNLKPEQRAQVLQRLRTMAEDGAAPDGAGDTEVVFEVTGGAPGERYAYRLAVQGDGAAERQVINELEPDDAGQASGGVDRAVAGHVFAAVAQMGLLDDIPAKAAPEQIGEILPDSMVAIVTVRDGDSVRRIAVPAVDPAMADGQLPGESEDIPLQTPFQLPAGSAAVLGPVLEALGAVEVAL